MESIKLGTAAGYDCIFPEFLKFLGPRARGWLCAFLGRVVSEKSVPKVWRQAKVVAPLKPGKDPKAVASYRPISLLSVPMKLLERLLLLRISPVLESVLSPDQAGFRKKRSTCDQVLAITTFIENGFQRGLKTGAIFLDLTAAYDTVWHTGLLVKLSRVLPRWFVETVELLISNRRFRVHLGDKVSSWRRQKNGLPQGSVLSPSLFNVYINDLPPTHSRKFIYADDICLGTQASNLVLLQERLQDDLSVMAEYCRTWRLIPSANKTVSSLFHLHHAASHSQLQLSIQGKSLRHDPLPVYLGVSLDRTLTYKDHIIKTAKKLKSRNNLISKLAGTNWGARTNTLRTSALALCYSVAEYCAPVWAQSAHVHRLDVQLNHTMRLISGTLRPTEIPWLPVLSNIAPPDIRRWAASAKLLSNIQSHDNLPLLQDIYDPPSRRLLSRNPIWAHIPDPCQSVSSKWKEAWLSSSAHNKDIILDPSVKVPGFDLPRTLWVKLNRFRVDCGCCARDKWRWGVNSSPLCSCGGVQSMTHIVKDCPLTSFPGGVAALHSASESATYWLKCLHH